MNWRSRKLAIGAALAAAAVLVLASTLSSARADADQRLHLSFDDSRRDARRHGSERRHPGVGPAAAHDPAHGYTAGILDDKLYLIDSNAGTATRVFDFASIAKDGWPQLMRITNDGSRLFITMNQAGKVVHVQYIRPGES